MEPDYVKIITQRSLDEFKAGNAGSSPALSTIWFTGFEIKLDLLLPIVAENSEYLQRRNS